MPGRARRAAGAVWRWLRGIDAEWRRGHNTAPLPLLRWLAGLGVAIGYWAKTGTPHSATGWLDAWLPALVVILLLVLPDAASITFGGLKLEMRHTREEVAGLRQQITLMSVQAQHQSQTVQVLGNPAVPATANTAAVINVAELQTGGDAPLDAIDRFIGGAGAAVDGTSPGDVRST